LYCDKVSKNGKKIPYLSKNFILKLAKLITNFKRVSYYIEVPIFEDPPASIFLEFDSIGNIYVKAEFKKAYSIEQIEDFIKNNINDPIREINDYLKISGYSLPYFNSLFDSNIDFNDIKFISYLSIDKYINLDSIIGCISSVFNIIIGDLKKGIVMRYKRVANF